MPSREEISLLVEKLLKESLEDKRCPNLRVDNNGPYCSINLSTEEISEKRRLVCDVYSLQLWCLDRTSCNKCIFYQGEQF